MKGQILDYSIQENKGVISGSDGNRYAFLGTEWKGDVHPSRGKSVDFDIEGGEAVAVYLALGHAGLQTISGPKSKAAAVLLALFLGGIGAHKFYMGSWGWGIVYLLTCWTWVPLIVALIEGVRYALMPDDEFYTKVENFEGQGPFGFFW